MKKNVPRVKEVLGCRQGLVRQQSACRADQGLLAARLYTRFPPGLVVSPGCAAKRDGPSAGRVGGAGHEGPS
jgi:hypothetical protein